MEGHMLDDGIYAVKGWDMQDGDVESGPCSDYNAAKQVAIKLLSDKPVDTYFLAWCSDSKYYWLKRVPGPEHPVVNENVVLFFKGEALNDNLVGVRD